MHYLRPELLIQTAREEQAHPSVSLLTNVNITRIEDSFTRDILDLQSTFKLSMLIKGIRTRRCHETLECSSSSVVRSSTQHGTPRNIIMTFYRGSIQEIHTADSRQCTAVCSDKLHRCFDDTTKQDFRRTSLFVTCTKTSRNASQRHPS